MMAGADGMTPELAASLYPESETPLARCKREGRERDVLKAALDWATAAENAGSDRMVPREQAALLAAARALGALGPIHHEPSDEPEPAWALELASEWLDGCGPEEIESFVRDMVAVDARAREEQWAIDQNGHHRGPHETVTCQVCIRLTRRMAELTADRDHWKANHGSVVRLKRKSDEYKEDFRCRAKAAEEANEALRAELKAAQDLATELQAELRICGHKGVQP